MVIVLHFKGDVMNKNKHDKKYKPSVQRLNLFKEVTDTEKTDIQKNSIITSQNIIIEDNGKDLHK